MIYKSLYSRNGILTISVIRSANSAMYSFRSQVGNGSSSHDLTGDSLIIFRSYALIDSRKVFSGTPEEEKTLSLNHLYVYLSTIIRSLCSIFCCRSINWEDIVSTIPHHIPSQSE